MLQESIEKDTFLHVGPHVGHGLLIRFLLRIEHAMAIEAVVICCSQFLLQPTKCEILLIPATLKNAK